MEQVYLVEQKAQSDGRRAGVGKSQLEDIPLSNTTIREGLLLTTFSRLDETPIDP